ncbi:MAG: HisA/HisF-related TIM barrel protein, partial [Candidatus Aureabacteria bacterium]|nr:HisA/HisF-related TIM barrel protein [Candidatus Auribacterota bacterium]
MIILPAIDILRGKCVRLYQGDAERHTVFGENPAAMAQRWEREGARYLHVVDLDGAFAGAPQNLDALRGILESVSIPVQFGGGLREINAVRRLFKMGVDRVILGTAAIEDAGLLNAAVGEFGRQVCVGMDLREGRVAVKGWLERSAVTPSDLLPRLERIGVGGVICTDIAADGTLSGPNIRLLDEMLT